MKIHSLTYEESRFGWKLEPVEFSNLTLLVGISGVGKTRILKALLRLKAIAEGKSFEGVSWNLIFSATNGVKYQWTGEFENFQTNSGPVENSSFDSLFEEEESKKIRPKIIKETLFSDGKQIIERNEHTIELNGVKMPKLSSFVSVLKTLGEEDAIIDAYKSFGRILFSDQSASVSGPNSFQIIEFSRISKKYSTLQSIRESSFPAHIKLALCYTHVREIFDDIRSRFISIFPHVEDVKAEPSADSDMPSFMQETPLVQIKERGVDQWITQQNMSSGMFRTIMHLAELFLSPDGTVILIDEFENSLGVNCIDVVTEDLLSESRRLQFIITSHHPYIINNVGLEYWNIVTRNGSTVSVHNAQDLHIGRSSHDAFMQLINSDQYTDGIQY